VRKPGIPTLLDRLIQQAVMQVLQGKWDRTFSDHSYGFRPGRSAHQAVETAQQQIEARVSERRMLKLIRAFRKAGMMESGRPPTYVYPATAIQSDRSCRQGPSDRVIQPTASPAQVRQAFGQPVFVADFGAGFQGWQFQPGDIDHHDFLHEVVFRKSTDSVISVTRNYAPEILVDHPSPVSDTSIPHYPNSEKPDVSFRVRRLPGERVLLDIGSIRPGQTTNQLLLNQRAGLPIFCPWLASQLDELSARRAH
jgi:hypothetical protein